LASGRQARPHDRRQCLRGGASRFVLYESGSSCSFDQPLDQVQVALAGEDHQEGGVRLGAALLEAGEDLGGSVGARCRQAFRAAPEPVEEDVGVPCPAEFAAILAPPSAGVRVSGGATLARRSGEAAYSEPDVWSSSDE
jgi:hypothetical protein